MNILFTICGRAGSKGIKNKNIRDFCGKPLPLYTLSAIEMYLQKNQKVSYDIVVNTDSKELIKIIQDNPWNIKVNAINRDESLAGDLVGKIDVIRDCYVKMTKCTGIEYDRVVDLDITSPLRTVDDIERLINTSINGNADVVFSVVESRRNPYFNMVKKSEDGFYGKVMQSDFTARQQAPEIFDMNASLYAYTVGFLKSHKAILEGRCDIIKMYDTGVLDLDHENDFEVMEIIARWLFEERKEFGCIRQNIDF